ncbi:hypothetical protein [Pseudonocardia acidicola]|uniref:Uncharacterized protein n=1 Tax=Pseudonocardia acidicola TaxID=2724939 RepID=A0ABX1SHP3_9PSEU|nr:hypothetical protein [Pseudonocardia acidicola]NMH99993.1 hypothetical protein [Pseudonocardia acidicola]
MTQQQIPADQARPETWPLTRSSSGLPAPELLTRYLDARGTLRLHLHGIGEPLTHAEGREHALRELRYGAALRDELDNLWFGRWDAAWAALCAGAEFAMVAAAMDVSTEALRAGLVEWADRQRGVRERHPTLGIGEEQYREVLRLIGEWA